MSEGLLQRARAISLGTMRVELMADDPLVIERFDRLLEAFPDAAHDGRSISVSITRHPVTPGLYDSRLDGDVLTEAMDLDEQAFRITRWMNDAKLDAEPQLLHLHSAAVARGHDVIILVGRSGSGKSTLAAALVRAGWAYVTDEIVTIDPATTHVATYPRPLTLRQGVWEHFPELERPDVTGSEEEGIRLEVPPLELGSVAAESELSIVAVVWPRFTSVDAGDRLDVQGLIPVGTAAAGVAELAACCYDLERLGVDGMTLLVEIAARGTTWQLPYENLDRAIAEVEIAWSAVESTEPLSLRHVRETGDHSALSPMFIRRAGDAHAWGFGDGSAVVYRPSTLTLSQLDTAGLHLWELLGTPMSTEDLATQAGATEPVLRDSFDRWLDTMIRSTLVEIGR